MTRVLLIVLFGIVEVYGLQGQFTCVKGNCYDGHGQALFPSGDQYEGSFEGGKINGLGVIFFSNGDRYSGNWKDNFRQGGGRFTFQDGSEYFGDFVRNAMEGRGSMKYANGVFYEGDWVQNYPHGFGNMTFASGNRYEGNFVKGRIEGKGIMYYADSRMYEGSWFDNKYHGEGVLTLADGSRREGIWESGEWVQSIQHDLGSKPIAVRPWDTVSLRNCNLEYCEAGLGSFLYPNGAHYTGMFSKGRPQGEGRIVYPEGDEYEGGWKGDQPEGRGTMYYRSGRILKAVWRAGQPNEVIMERGPVSVVDLEEVEDNITRGVKVWAVIVGAAQYRHLPALRYTDDDAYQIYAFLRSPQGGALPDDQIRLLVDEDATRGAVLGAMHQLFDQADANDAILFYFSGHGVEGAFLPIDFDGFNNRLMHEELRAIIDQSPAKHKLVLADACHSGSYFRARSSVQSILDQYYTAFAQSTGGLALLLSSKGEEYSLEDGGLRSGVFSHFLIKGLKGPADRNLDKVVTVEELHRYIQSNVATYTGNVQNPVLMGAFDPEMPIGVIRR